MAKMCISMSLQPPILTVGGSEVKLTLPEGAVGMLFVWKTKKAARKWHSKKVNLVEIQELPHD